MYASNYTSNRSDKKIALSVHYGNQLVTHRGHRGGYCNSQVSPEGNVYPGGWGGGRGHGFNGLVHYGHQSHKRKD